MARRSSGGKRDYKAEYRRRIASGKKLGLSVSQSRGHPKKTEHSATFEKIRRKVRADAKKVFGNRKVPKLPPDAPRIDSGGGRSYPDPFTYEEFLKDKQKREGKGNLPWTDERAFIESITAMGLTENEAYTLWFSP